MSMASGAVRMGRAVAESLMTDRLTGEVESGTTWDEEQGQTIPTWTSVYDGPGRVKVSAVDNLTDDGGDITSVQGATLSLPVVGSGSIKVGTVFTIAASESDPENVGRKFRVTAPFPQTNATARRFQVEHYS